MHDTTSSPAPTTTKRLPRWALALGLLSIGLLVGLAGAAGAQTIEDVQSFTWAEEGSSALAEDHVWNNIKQDDDAKWREIPADGHALVELNYSGMDPNTTDTITFRYVLDTEFNQEDRTEYEYTFAINDAGDGHAPVNPPEEQNVFLAENVNATFQGRDTEASTTDDGCRKSLDDLHRATGDNGCYFLVELPNEDSGRDISAEVGKELTLEVDVGGQTQEETADGDDSTHRSVQPANQDLSINRLDFTAGTVSSINDTTLEAGVTLDLNLTLATGGSDSSRSTSSGDGDVDAWVCLFETGEDDEPYANYADFAGDDVGSHSPTATEHQWDDPVACRVMDFPTGHADDELDSEQNHAVSMGDAERPHDSRSDRSNNDLRYFEETFRIDREEVEIDNGEFVDDFDLQVVARDAIGNFLTAGHEESTANDGPFTVAHMEVGQAPVDVGLSAGTERSDVKVSDFTQNDGCVQLDGSGSSATVTTRVAANNGAGTPCFRSLDHAPPDQPIEIPILVENYANVEDEIEISWNDEGGEDWDVELAGPSDTGSTITETLDPATPASSSTNRLDGEPWKDATDPESIEVTVRLTPNPSSTAAVAGAGDDPTLNGTTGFMTVETRTDSTYSELPSGDEAVRNESYERGQLVQDAKGTIDFGEDRQTTVTVDAQAQQEETIDLTVENTGNTDGPFEVTINEDQSPPECGTEVNTDDPDEATIDFRLVDPDQGRTEVGAETIGPAQDPQTYELEIEVGPSVGLDSYACEFSFVEKPSGSDLGDRDDPVTLDPPSLEPTVTVNVEGTPDIQIWDTQPPNREQVNVTGQQVNLTIPPGTGSERLFFFLENAGDVGLNPELDTDDGWPLEDRYGLDDQSTWRGVDIEDGTDETVSLATAESSFPLPISDVDEREDILVRDLFPGSDDVDPPLDDEIDAGGELWDCAGRDDDNDGEDRSLCRLVFEYDYEDAVLGDEVTYRFTWQDPQESEQASSVDVHLTVGYPGEVEATDVTRSVIDDGTTSTVTFDAELDDGHRFDLQSSSDVEAGVDVSYEYAETGDTVECSTPADAFSTTPEEATSATFQLDVTAANESSAVNGCEASADAGDLELSVEPPASSASINGTAALTLNVADENDTQLRQVQPAHVHVIDADADQPDAVTGESLSPSGSLQADGTQHVEYTFDHPQSPFPGGDEAAVLYRTDDDEDTDALEPYSERELNTEGTLVGETTDSDRAWTQQLPASETASYEDPTYNEDDRINASENVDGVLFREANDNDPVRVGDVNITGWGDTDAIEWTEGWNPVVFRVADQEGDELEDGLAASDLALTLKLAVRNATTTDSNGDPVNGNITDTYELSSEGDTIVTRYLGNGYLAADIYLPDGLSENDLNGGQDVGSREDPILADHPMEDSGEVEMEAWALHLEISNGQSTDGQDLSGDAYWRADPLGLAVDEGLASPEQNGTGGTSLVLDTGNSAVATTTLDEDPTDTEGDEDLLHVLSKFQNGPTLPDGNWETGPGIHDYQVFLLEETRNEQSSSETIDDEETAGNVVEHSFQPFSDAQVDLQVISGTRGEDAPGAGTTDLDENATVPGQFEAFFGLPDTGSDTSWISQVDVLRDGVNVVSTNAKEVTVDERRQASSHGLPMPLVMDEPELFRTQEGLGDDVTLDTRAVPGLLPDRGDFGLAAAVAPDDPSGFLLELADDGSTIFTVEGEGLLTVDDENLPTVGEENRAIKLTGDRAISPTPASAVAGVEVELTLDGDTVDTDELSETGQNEWTGSVTPTEKGDHRLIVRAEDTAGGLTTVASTVNVTEDLPPEITVDAPTETDGTRAMPSDGTVEATVLDNAITSEDVTYEEKLGTDDGDQPAVLSAENASFDSLREEENPGEFSVTIDLNATEGNAWLNVTDRDGEGAPDAQNASSDIEATSFTDGSVSGTLWLNETGTYTLAVQTNGTDGVDEEFTVDVVEDSGDGFSPVDLGDDLSCDAGECTITHAPDGLSDGDTYQFRITADDGEQETISGPHEVTVDDEPPTVSLEVGSPSADGSPTVVGPDTTVTVDASDTLGADGDEGPIDQLTVRGLQGGTETGSSSLEAGDEVSMSQLGLDGSGTATLEANATDLAGNDATENVDVVLDTGGPSIQTPSTSATGGADIRITATVTDDAGIERVRLHHQAPGAAQFTSTRMSSVGGDDFEATVSPGTSGTLEYYVTAGDRLGNEEQLRSSSNPFTLDLDGLDFENRPPEASIASPSEGDTVSGTVNLTVNASDPDEDSLELAGLSGESMDTGDVTSLPTDGAAFQDGTATVAVDTSQFPDGSVLMEAEVTDGLETVTASVTLIVDNQPTPGACPGAGDELRAGEDVEICFSHDTPENAVELEVALVQNDETVDTVTLQPSSDGEYRASFDIPGEGTYVLQITTTLDDDGQETTTTDTFNVASAAQAAAEPLGRFVATLLLGVAVVGLAAFAAFGRWG